MANRFIIDDENISVNNILTLARLGKKDKIYIISNGTKRLNLAVLKDILETKASIKITLINAQGKDFADKIIVFLMGKFFSKKGKIYVVSNDKFYDDIIEFYNLVKPTKFQKLSVLPKNTEEKKPQILEKKESPKAKILAPQTTKVSPEIVDKIRQIAKCSANLMEFHNALTREFGNDGSKYYMKLKEKAKTFFAKNKKSAQKG